MKAAHSLTGKEVTKIVPVVEAEIKMLFVLAAVRAGGIL
jgi:hypothetical protein